MLDGNPLALMTLGMLNPVQLGCSLTSFEENPVSLARRCYTGVTMFGASEQQWPDRDRTRH